jgi:quercetin dioxygenase-like cupin family protein
MKKQTILFILFIFICVGLTAQYKEDVIIEKLMQTDTTALGQKITYPQFANDEVTICKVTIPVGKSTGWHKHQIPVFAYIMKGTLTVKQENGKTNIYPQNSTVSEIFNTFHNGFNEGNEEVVLIAVYLGGKDVPLSVKKPQR